MNPEASPIAPIEALRQQLEDKQEVAVDLASKALAGVDSVIGTANFYLAVIGIVIGIAGIIGGAAIVYLANRGAKRIAVDSINSYIASGKVDEALRRAISDEIKSQLKDRTFVMVSPDSASGTQPGSFPQRNWEARDL